MLWLYHQQSSTSRPPPKSNLHILLADHQQAKVIPVWQKFEWVDAPASRAPIPLSFVQTFSSLKHSPRKDIETCASEYETCDYQLKVLESWICRADQYNGPEGVYVMAHGNFVTFKDGGGLFAIFAHSLSTRLRSYEIRHVYTASSFTLYMIRFRKEF